MPISYLIHSSPGYLALLIPLTDKKTAKASWEKRSKKGKGGMIPPM